MEIFFRSLFIFFFLWGVTRAVGRSSLGELSTFQLILYVTMGDLVQQAVTQQDYSVTAAVIAVSTFALLTVGIGYIGWRWRRSRPLLHGVPVLVVRDGEPLVAVMRHERMTLDELYAQAREQGIAKLGEVRYAVLETDGKISFFSKDGQSSGAPEPQPSAS
jgi:uncharacterized membrane protein YcaP (DUF421 family)